MSDPVRLQQIRQSMATEQGLRQAYWDDVKYLLHQVEVLTGQLRALQQNKDDTVAACATLVRMVNDQAATVGTLREQLAFNESRSPDGDGQQGQRVHAKDSVLVTDAVAATALPRQREAGSIPADSLQLKLEAADAALTALRQERDAQLAQMTKTVEFHRDMAARLAEDRDEKKHALREAKAALTACQQERDEARERVFAVDRERAEIQNRYAVMEARLSQTQIAQHDLAALQEERDRCQATVSDLRASIEQLYGQLARAKNLQHAVDAEIEKSLEAAEAAIHHLTHTTEIEKADVHSDRDL